MLNLRALKLYAAIAALAATSASHRTTARSSLKHKSLVRIIVVCYALCRSSLKKIISKTRTPSAQYILTLPLPRIYRISQRYGSLRPSSRPIALAKRCGRKSRQTFRISHPKGQLNGSSTNETYDLVNDPGCCEWRFLCSALPFQEGKGEGGGGEEE